MEGLILDQAMIEEVAKYCPDQFLNLHKCIGDGKASGKPVNCWNQQSQLSSCVKSKVPSFKKIKTDCGEQFEAYKNCIKKDPEFKTTCFDQLQDLRECSAKSLGLSNWHQARHVK
ncbi:hypothetical protein CANCADRAFT_92619 [Tortispora caseinolytica NRRL Y-17796]|uniref:IMS import disulfide relay-system CHCH-CHCH-like Cx9C domain-containing protein n=1 Tax=Tortispora caseinolytica NRRL Y-17796 TaxID=767744 RepID=A0A1E4TLY4_9ASCO|nr:hypothetical protein CANCADRAFT_92619 [Tortispora caseinolytica NRRL Y-17796]